MTAAETSNHRKVNARKKKCDMKVAIDIQCCVALRALWHWTVVHLGAYGKKHFSHSLIQNNTFRTPTTYSLFVDWVIIGKKSLKWEINRRCCCVKRKSHKFKMKLDVSRKCCFHHMSLYDVTIVPRLERIPEMKYFSFYSYPQSNWAPLFPIHIVGSHRLWYIVAWWLSAHSRTGHKSTVRSYCACIFRRQHRRSRQFP